MVFPRLLVGTGFAKTPGLVTDALAVSSGVNGASLQQCEVIFDQPVGASLNGLYVIFEIPAVGSYLGDEGSHGWISGDWNSLEVPNQTTDPGTEPEPVAKPGAKTKVPSRCLWHNNRLYWYGNHDFIN